MPSWALGASAEPPGLASLGQPRQAAKRRPGNSPARQGGERSASKNRGPKDRHFIESKGFVVSGTMLKHCVWSTTRPEPWVSAQWRDLYVSFRSAISWADIVNATKRSVSRLQRFQMCLRTSIPALTGGAIARLLPGLRCAACIMTGHDQYRAENRENVQSRAPESWPVAGESAVAAAGRPSRLRTPSVGTAVPWGRLSLGDRCPLALPAHSKNLQ
jgi:hypothetical protein